MDLKLSRNEDNIFDLSLGSDGDLVTDGGLETSVYISVLTNKRADETEITNSFNRYGWWADTFRDINNTIGSKLYQLKRAKNITDELEKVRLSIQQSLKWLVNDGVSFKNTVKAVRTGTYSADFIINIFKPSGVETFNFDFAWNDF